MIVCPACGHRHGDADFDCGRCGYRPRIDRGIPLLAPALAAEVDGFDPEAFAMLASRERGHFWFEARNRLILWAMQRHFADARRYLEVGCGTGFVLGAVHRARPDLHIIGSEVLAAGLEHAARRAPGARLLQMDARAIPFEREFDVIGAFDVLEHIREDEDVIAQLRSALAPGGGVILCVPQHPTLWSSQDDLARHVRRYRRGELETKLRRAGFSIHYSTSFMTPLLPLLWMARRRRISDSAPLAQANEELSPPHWLNRLLTAVLHAEAALLRIGLRLPAGSSRLVVARLETVTG